jgi:hypothetical protein
MFHKMWRISSWGTVSFSRRYLLWNYLEVYLSKHRAQKDAEAVDSCSSSPQMFMSNLLITIEKFAFTGGSKTEQASGDPCYYMCWHIMNNGLPVIAPLLLEQFHCWCNLKFDTLLYYVYMTWRV